MDLLPDEVLLDIFDLYLNAEHADAWHTLIHVCQRWRTIVLSSPRRLNLRILCKNTRPVRKMLDIWPAFPIVVWHDDPDPFVSVRADDIVAALEHPNRVREIRFKPISTPMLLDVRVAMDVPFSVLTTFELKLSSTWSPVIPNPFLGGSAPRLQSLDLDFMCFPSIRKLLLSANDLIYLSLSFRIYGDNVPPEEIATCLSSMARLESISLVLQYDGRDYPCRLSPPLSRAILPALTYFGFKGAGDYLGALMAHLDAPLLDGVTLL